MAWEKEKNIESPQGKKWIINKGKIIVLISGFLVLVKGLEYNGVSF